MLGLVGLAFRVGQIFERRAMQAYRNQSDPLKPFRETPVNSGLIPRTVSRIDAQGAAPVNPSLAESNDDPALAVDDPREPGLNYFRMLQIDASYAAEADRVIRFLATQGVDAAAIPINNGRFVKVVALRGFQRVGDEAAVAYKRDLQRLGRKWKTEHKGTTDWNDLYAEKFIPGRT